MTKLVITTLCIRHLHSRRGPDLCHYIYHHHLNHFGQLGKTCLTGGGGGEDLYLFRVPENLAHENRVHTNCLGCLLIVVLCHVGASVFSSYSTKRATRAHCLPRSSQLLSVLPTSVSRLHNFSSVSIVGIQCVSGIPIETFWLVL